LDLENETVIFNGDSAARTAAIIHLINSRGKEQLEALILKILDHIYALENP